MPTETVDCPRCGKSFETDSSMKAHFAAKNDDLHSGSIASSTVECETCGEEFTVHESRRVNGDTRFCSNECKGKKYSKEKKNRIKVSCYTCGKEFNKRKCEITQKNFCSNDCRTELSGENHYNWKENSTNLNYGDNWQQIRDFVLKRDFHSCRLCRVNEETHIKNNGYSLDIHHKKPLKEFDDIEDANNPMNLITLCRDCHMKVERMEVEL